MVHATDQFASFEEGWLVSCPGQVVLTRADQRAGLPAGRLLTEQKLVSVSTTIRLKDIKFSNTQGGPQDRE